MVNMALFYPHESGIWNHHFRATQNDCIQLFPQNAVPLGATNSVSQALEIHHLNHWEKSFHQTDVELTPDFSYPHETLRNAHVTAR
jgi:hypothetical protein